MTGAAASFHAAVAARSVLVLDGAMGTELQRRGVDVSAPLWSARALLTHPDEVRALHAAYALAGADVLTAVTFRCNLRALRAAELEPRAAELTATAIRLAREAAENIRTGTTSASPPPSRASTPPHGPDALLPLVAGSIAPVADCYHPELAPSDAELDDEHGRFAELLAGAGADVLLCETHGLAREAAAAARACHATGRSFAVSLLARRDGRLLSGETIDDAVDAVLPYAPDALLINCVSARDMHMPLAALLGCSPVPVGCYANIGTPEPNGIDIRAEIDDDGHLREALIWRQMGACMIGGCCGTTPSFIAALRRRLDAASETPR